MTRDWIGWLLFVPGVGLSIWYYAPSLRIADAWDYVRRGVRRSWSSLARRVRRWRSWAADKARRLWASARGKPLPTTIGPGGFAAGTGTGYGSATLVHPKGEAAIDALFEGLAAQRREFEAYKSEHADDHVRERRQAEAMARRSAVTGMVGFLLVVVATVVWNIPRPQ
jgi:hypothetical protein